MLIEAKSEEAKDVRVVDSMGKEIPFVKSFNTETKEAEIYIRAKDDSPGKKIVVVRDEGETIGRPLLVKVSLPGCKAINKVTGEEIK